MLALTSQEYLEKHREEGRSLAVSLRKYNSEEGKCIGSTAMIQYTRYMLFKPELTRTLAAGGCIDALEYCLSAEDREDEGLNQIAANNGQTATIAYLRGKNCFWDARVPAEAARNGYLQTLEYLHQWGCPWDFRTPSFAAENNHIEILKVAHKNRCQINDSATLFAAGSGQLEALHYLCYYNFPLSDSALEIAEDGNHMEIVEYLRNLLNK